MSASVRIKRDTIGTDKAKNKYTCTDAVSERVSYLTLVNTNLALI